MAVLDDAIDRREALRRVALVLGGALSGPAIAGVLAGCRGDGDGRAARASASTPRALTAPQTEMVATIAEHIIPETDTPGARAAGVHLFVDAMLAGYYPAADRERFIAGLAAVDERARREHGRDFLLCDAAAQRALVARLDAEAFAEPGAPGGPAAAPPAPPSFFRMLKELTLIGYYTSRVGATRELRYIPVPGRYDGCVPLAANGGRAWAL